jgi:hypothetical protein
MADSSNSLLKTAVERIRGYLDDPDLEAKYTDDYIVRHVFQPAFATVTSRLNNSASNPVLKRLTFPLVKNQQYYQLPPCVGEVWRLAIVDNTGNVTQEAIPRGLYNYRGPNWQIEGNMLSFLPYPDTNYSSVELWYCPSGDFQPVYCTTGTGVTIGGSNTQVTINISSATIGLGSFDRRPSAYVGQIFRFIGGLNSNVVEERMIETWEKGVGSFDWIATFRRPLVNNLTPTAFEISPEGSESLYEAVACAGAMKLAGYRKTTGDHFMMIQAQYRDAMKTLMDRNSNMQMRMPKSWQKDTVDNELGQSWRF